MDSVIFMERRFNGRTLADLSEKIGQEVFCAYLETHDLTVIETKGDKAILHQKGSMAWNGIGAPRYWCSPEIWVVQRGDKNRWNRIEITSLSRSLNKRKVIAQAKEKHGI